jgi:hypothetical protein
MEEIAPSSFQHAFGWNPAFIEDLDPGQKIAGVTG